MTSAPTWGNTPLQPEAVAIGMAVVWSVLAVGLSKGRLSIAFNLIAACLGGWALSPRPLPVFVMVMTVLPWLVLAITAAVRGRIQLLQDAEEDIDPRPDATMLILAPLGALWWAILTDDITLIDGIPALLAGFGLAAAMATVAMFARMPNPIRFSSHFKDIRSRVPIATRRSLQLCLVIVAASLAWAYGFSVIAFANIMLDKAPATTYAVPVVGKASGSGRRPRYYIEVAPWPLDTNGHDHFVTKQMFMDVKPGDSICFTVHPGRFGLRWQKMGLCG